MACARWLFPTPGGPHQRTSLFSRTKRPARVFVLSEALPALVAEALRLLDADGRLLVSTNHRGMSAAELEQIVRKAARGRPATISAAAPLPLDFAGDSGHAASVVVRVQNSSTSHSRR